MSVYDNYSTVVGLEVHAQLQTKSKAFSPDAVSFGDSPNTNIHPISLGHPGTLPTYNKEALKMACMAGIAFQCTIHPYTRFARKNYFYADLPKGYQISQYDTPLCTEGKIEITNKEEVSKVIGIHRIHVEEDSGKSIHDLDPFHSLIDLNRAGTALIEIVSDPDMRSGDDAYFFLNEIRRLVRYLGICDGNMEEGSLRCDANISVMKKGAKEFGQKVEVKNMNSIRNVKRAIEFETIRQIDALEKGEKILQQTMGFNAEKGETFVMRTKETATDYRYFTEPDLPPLKVTEEYISEVKNIMPPLPKELFKVFQEEYGLNQYDSNVLLEDKEIALFFHATCQKYQDYKGLANWIQGPIKAYLNDQSVHLHETEISPERLIVILQLIETGKVNYSAASQNLLPEVMQSKDEVETLAKKLNIIQENDMSALETWVKEVLEEFPDKVEEYRNGKKGILGLFMGQVMRKAKGKLDPKLADEYLRNILDK